MVDHSLLRNGNKVLVDNQPYVIMDTDFVNPGKGQAFTKIKIKNLLNKKTIEKTVKIGEELDQADVLNSFFIQKIFYFNFSKSLAFTWINKVCINNYIRLIINKNFIAIP